MRRCAFTQSRCHTSRLLMLSAFDSAYKEKSSRTASTTHCRGSYGDGNLSEVVETTGSGFNSGVRRCEAALQRGLAVFKSFGSAIACVLQSSVYGTRCYGFSQCAVRCLTITPWDEKKEKPFYYTFLQVFNMVLITIKQQVYAGKCSSTDKIAKVQYSKYIMYIALKPCTKFFTMV